MASTMPIDYEPLIEGGRPFVRADLEDMPDDGRRYELIDGTLIVSAAPGRLHQRAVHRIAVRLDNACTPDLEMLIAPFSVILGDHTEMQPDVLVAHRADLTERNLPAAPALAVEVLSPSSRLIDTHVKRERFERAGTRSYWVIDPVARPDEARLIAWELGADKKFREVANVVGAEAFAATMPFPVTIVPADLVR